MNGVAGTGGASVSIGVAGALGPDLIGRIAAAAENAGLHGLWVNDTPGGDSLAALRAAAGATQRLMLGTGVIPLDRRSVEEITRESADLPAARVTLGIGSGQVSGPVLERMRSAAHALRERTAARVMIGALGPRMRQLAVAESDGMLLNWLTPDAAAAQSAAAHEQAEAAHEQAPGTRVVLYVRAALADEALPRLRAEAARYGEFPHYAANFSRLGFDASDTVITPENVAEALPAYRAAVDEVVLRAITLTDDAQELQRFVEQASHAAQAVE